MSDKNLVKFGLKNIYYSLVSFDDDGNPTFAVPVRIPGAVSLSLDNTGETEPWYADDSIYIALSGASGYEGTLEVAILPDSFLTDILHEEEDTNGVFAEVSDVEVEHFALLFEFSGDKHKTRHVLYNCIAARPGIESETKEDSAEPATDELDLTVMPLANGYVKARTTENTPSSVYDSWFESVYEPQEAAEEDDESDEEAASG